jgi:hypothetical protein
VVEKRTSIMVVTIVIQVCLQSRLPKHVKYASQNRIKRMKSSQFLIKMTAEKKNIFRMHKASLLLIAAALIVVAFIFFSPVFSQSTNPCSPCHGGYYQYLDILEGNSANQLPTTLNVGGITTVSVVVQNNVNTGLFTALSSVSVKLSSQSGHFSVSVPTITIGTLQKGTVSATWQITALSAGTDNLVISASAQNNHKSNLLFQDSYSPNPVLTILDPVPTPTPIAPPTSTPTPTPVPTPISSPSSNPSPTTTPAPSPTPTSTPNPTPITTSSPTPIPTPNPTSSITPTPNYTINPTTSPTPTITSTPTPNPSISSTTTPTSTFTPIPTTDPTSTATPTSTPTNETTSTPTPTPNTINPTPTPDQSSANNTFTTPNSELTNQGVQNSQTPTLRVWFRHPSLDETWISGSTKIIEWGTTYGSNNIVAKVEFSKNGPTGDWTTLAENLTNVNYFIWKVPKLEQNDNYYICVTVFETSTPEKVFSDMNTIKIAATADNQFMLGFLFIPGITILILALARKQAKQILNNKTIIAIQIKAAKYPTLSQYYARIESLLSTFRINSRGRKND